MTNSTATIKYPIKPAASIDDDTVLQQLPINIRHQLGDTDGSGFDLFLHKRELFFQHGMVSYVLGEATALVELD